jgi:hypothetical protein
MPIHDAQIVQTPDHQFTGGIPARQHFEYLFSDEMNIPFHHPQKNCQNSLEFAQPPAFLIDFSIS